MIKRLRCKLPGRGNRESRKTQPPPAVSPGTLLNDQDAFAKPPPTHIDPSVTEASVLKPQISPGRPKALDPVWHSLHKTHCATLRSARHLHNNGVPEGGLEFIMYGDSITEVWTGSMLGSRPPDYAKAPELWKKHFGHLRGAALAIAGDSVEQLQWRLQNGEAPSSVGARLAVLHIGTNDLGFQVAEDEELQRELAAKIMGCAELILQAEPELNLVLLAILPKMFGQPNRCTPGIEGVNALLKQYCDHTPRASFCDCGACFISSDEKRAWLDVDLMPDGLHPSVAGLDIIAGSLHPFLQRHLWLPPVYAAGTRTTTLISLLSRVRT